MKKANIEQFSVGGYQLYVDDTPRQTDKSVKLWGYSAFPLLVKSWAYYRDRLVITIKEEGDAISMFIAKSKAGNGFIKREMEGGERVIGKVFDIVSPIYYIQNPQRGDSNRYSGLKKTYDAALPNDTYAIFFPNTTPNVYAIFNDTSPLESFTHYKERYGLCFGVAGKSLFFESISFEVDTNLMNGTNKLETITVNNSGAEGASEYVPWVGGYYKIL